MNNYRVTARQFFGNETFVFDVKAGTVELAEASITMRLEALGYYVVSVRLMRGGY